MCYLCVVVLWSSGSAGCCLVGCVFHTMYVGPAVSDFLTKVMDFLVNAFGEGTFSDIFLGVGDEFVLEVDCLLALFFFFSIRGVFTLCSLVMVG